MAHQRAASDALRRHGAAVLRHGGADRELQFGVYLAYASRYGQALIDRQLFLPEAWAAAQARRAKAGVPKAVAFATKPAIARELIAAALDAGLPCAFVLADAPNGSDKRPRMILEARAQPYVLAVCSNERLMTVADGFATRGASGITKALPDSARRRNAAGEGAKGPRLNDWARVRLQAPPWDHWLLVRRRLREPFRRRLRFKLETTLQSSSRSCTGTKP